MHHFMLLETLDVLFQLSRDGLRIDELTIARRANTPTAMVRRCLKRLEELGLCDATHTRLTMRGLAVAVSHDVSVLRAEPLRRVA